MSKIAQAIISANFIFARFNQRWAVRKIVRKFRKLRTMPFFSALAQFALRSMPVFSALAQFAFANR